MAIFIKAGSMLTKEKEEDKKKNQTRSRRQRAKKRNSHKRGLNRFIWDSLATSTASQQQFPTNEMKTKAKKGKVEWAHANWMLQIGFDSVFSENAVQRIAFNTISFPLKLHSSYRDWNVKFVCSTLNSVIASKQTATFKEQLQAVANKAQRFCH